jgi:hypothetical protein
VHCGGEIGTYTAQSKNLRWDKFGSLTETNYNGENLWDAVDLNLISTAACNMVCPHIEDGRLHFISNGLAISYNLLINNSAKPFCVCTWATGCSTLIPIDVQ